MAADDGSYSLKQPDTPPDSLESDPYAQYIYQQELELEDDLDLDLTGRGRQTIIVGDIHGSLNGFDKFLKAVEFDRKRDVLILAGDIVAKGPRSLQVIDRARELKARCVRGNHDDSVIRWKGFLDTLSSQELKALDGFRLDKINENDDDVDDDDDIDDDDDWEEQEDDEEWPSDPSDNINSGKGSRRPRIPSDLERNPEHYELARALNKEQYHYLRNCPLILSLPKELSVHKIPIHVVHAGIDPHRDILKQRPWVLINVRNLLKDGTPSRKKKKGQGWAKAFNKLHSRRSPAKRDFLVVYGHDAGRGLNIRKWSIGIDTGCVYGRELTGYIVETGMILSVPCSKI
ncbi:hypothetical protein BGZ98_004184 [Dissophora globulifera]|nr:hypothetical protein BGZ98_004184 [Dissophora globulifera]